MVYHPSVVLVYCIWIEFPKEVSKRLGRPRFRDYLHTECRYLPFPPWWVPFSFKFIQRPKGVISSTPTVTLSMVHIPVIFGFSFEQDKNISNVPKQRTMVFLKYMDFCVSVCSTAARSKSGILFGQDRLLRYFLILWVWTQNPNNIG